MKSNVDFSKSNVDARERLFSVTSTSTRTSNSTSTINLRADLSKSNVDARDELFYY